MEFIMPKYTAPDFSRPEFLSAPDAAFERVEKDGVAPENFHSTSMYPEYVKLEGRWRLAEESRMDSCIVWNADGSLSVVESRNLKKGDRVIVGRSEDGREGIYLHSTGFGEAQGKTGERFVFRQGRSRETSYARDYDRLIRLLRYEKEHGGKVIWVMGPAFSFDADARRAMEGTTAMSRASWRATPWPSTTWKAPCSTPPWARISTPRVPSPRATTITWT